MNRRPVRSSNVASVGYEKRTLEVEFRTGAVYQYSGVHPNTFQAMLRAPSKGKFMWKNVRGRYPARRT